MKIKKPSLTGMSCTEYLGRFKKDKFVQQGHNGTAIQSSMTKKADFNKVNSKNFEETVVQDMKYEYEQKAKSGSISNSDVKKLSKMPWAYAREVVDMLPEDKSNLYFKLTKDKE